jgi:parvulin-like peptidyl-prolyl isomerase
MLDLRVRVNICVCVFALALGWSSMGSSQAPNLAAMDIVTKSMPDGPVARVGKTNIEKLDFLMLYQAELGAFGQQSDGKNLTDGDRVRIALLVINVLLEEELLYQEAILSKLSVDKAEVKRRADDQITQLQKALSEQLKRDVGEAELLKQLEYESRAEVELDIERKMLITAMRAKIVKERSETIPDEIVRAAYDKSKSEMVLPSLLHLKHISVRGYADDPEDRKAGLAKANKALNSIYSGKVFDTVAQEFSERLDPVKGCDLGMAPVQALPPFMVEAALKMEIGDVSDVIESETGLHIIYLVAREAGGTIAADKGLKIVRQRLAMEQKRLLVREYCDNLILSGTPVRVFLELKENLRRNAKKESAEAK